MDIKAQNVISYCTFLLFAFALLSPIIIFLFTNSKRRAQLPPGPFVWPIIGNLLNLDGKKPHISLANLSKSYGPLISLRFGAKLIVVASSPEAAREVLKNSDRDLSGRYAPQLASILPQVFSSSITLAAECNQRWRFLRATAYTKIFSAQAMELRSQIRLEKAKGMLKFLSLKEGEAVRIVDVLFGTSANIVSNAMVSQDIVVNDFWKNSGEMMKSILSLIELAIPGLADLYPAIRALDFSLNQKAIYFNEINKKIWGDIVRKRRSRQDVAVSERDYLDVLVENSFDDCQIYNLLTELLLTVVSISTALEWAMTELIKNQEAFYKLRDELTRETKDTIISESHLTRLPYLQACIKEVIRLHPPGPLIFPRCALQTCKVMNCIIPMGTLVTVSVYALGRDSKTWDDPQSFNPERFLGKNLDVKGNNYVFLPFGGGSRMCAGYQLALRQMQLLLASLVNAFDWSLPPGMEPAANLDMTENFRIQLIRENPLLLIPKMRNNVQKCWV